MPMAGSSSPGRPGSECQSEQRSQEHVKRQGQRGEQEGAGEIVGEQIHRKSQPAQGGIGRIRAVPWPGRRRGGDAVGQAMPGDCQEASKQQQSNGEAQDCAASGGTQPARATLRWGRITQKVAAAGRARWAACPDQSDQGHSNLCQFPWLAEG